MDAPRDFILVDQQFINLGRIVFARFVEDEEELTLWIDGFPEPIFFKGERGQQVLACLRERARELPPTDSLPQ